mmetsp:Transcript_14805/g.47958  ORF Transcript_14805/g.47958 Transcript_14805/m.47958 type:complete len:443 (-) Transcript_14805:24-1352(-)
MHLKGAADRSCDHWHDDAGVLNHHAGITWLFEAALRSVDATTAAHYWDYTVDAADLGDAWPESFVFGDDWFGAPESDTHVVSRGRFAFTAVRRNAAGYANTTNAFGLLRSPWNASPVPFLARSTSTLGLRGNGYGTFPTCAMFASVLRDGKLSTILRGANGQLHGPVHIMVGGHWGFDENKWASYFADYAPFSPSQVLLFSKFAWRTGFVTCPRACAADAPPEACRCSCPDAAAAAGDDAKALEVLDAMKFRAHALPFSDAFADAALEAGAATDDGAFFGAHGLSASDILDLVCAVGYPGELFTSAAPQDPLFWPLHGLAERFLQYARVLDALGAIDLDEAWRYKHRKNVASDTGVVCDWSTGSPACAAATCPGHREDDLLPFEGLFPGQVGLVSNRDFYDRSSPLDGDLDYVYDTLDDWPGCAGGTPLLPASDDDDRGPPA